MAKIKYNVKDVERGGRDFVQPKPGLYEMEIKEAKLRDADGKNDIEIVLEITKDNDEFVGSRVWTYINLGESSQWKLAELVDAIGLPQAGEIDPAKLVGKKMKVKVNPDSWGGEYRARVGRLAPLSADAEATDEEPGGDDEAPGETEHTVIERNNVELSTDPEYYADWTDQDVFDEVENQKISLGRKKKSRVNVIALLVELVAAESGGGGDGDGNDTETAADQYDDADQYYDAYLWSDAALAAEYKKRGLDTITGKKNRQKVIDALRADDTDDDDPFAD